jgi:hypothetical protein
LQPYPARRGKRGQKNRILSRDILRNCYDIGKSTTRVQYEKWKRALVKSSYQCSIQQLFLAASFLETYRGDIVGEMDISVEENPLYIVRRGEV